MKPSIMQSFHVSEQILKKPYFLFCSVVMTAELIKYYYPQYVDLHNYSPVSKRSLKVENWSTLNRKVGIKQNLKT